MLFRSEAACGKVYRIAPQKARWRRNAHIAGGQDVYKRQQLGPFEQARALRDLLNLWNCTQEAGARRLGIAQPTLCLLYTS